MDNVLKNRQSKLIAIYHFDNQCNNMSYLSSSHRLPQNKKDLIIQSQSDYSNSQSQNCLHRQMNMKNGLRKSSLKRKQTTFQIPSPQSFPVVLLLVPLLKRECQKHGYCRIPGYSPKQNTTKTIPVLPRNPDISAMKGQMKNNRLYY